MNNIVFTIGHSTHSVEKLIELLNLHKINVVADVRSSPFSRVNPQFNRNELQRSLKDIGINYVFLGKELGARSEISDCYLNDKVQYEKIVETEQFKYGIERIIDGAKSYQMALMCAEKEPLDCHRTILVSRELIRHNLDIRHILADGSLETHRDSLERLMANLNIAKEDMFLSEEDIQDIAYKKQAEKIAYVRSEHKLNSIDRDRNPVSFGANQ